jgi:hypothetical protein
MAKAIRAIGTVVGVVVTAVGAITGNPALVALGMKIVTYSNLAAAAIDLINPPAKPSFGGEGNALAFQTNPQSGLPYPLGRTRMSGLRIHADTYDAIAFKSEGKQDVLSFAVMLGAGGPMEAIESFRADKEVQTFDGSGNATGANYEYMAQKVSLGLVGASALALAFGGADFPGWGVNHKLSGIAHALWSLRYDEKGEHFGAGVPEPEWVGKWVKVYDPRKDSTYPGGSGSHRALDETTYEWSANPALHALTWSLGRWQNGKRTLGIGAQVGNIRVADFVEAANIADANGWTCGGVEWSTDSKWSVLKRMLQAGGAEPTMTAAMIGCRVNAPRVSIATVDATELLENASFPATKPRRDRFNTVIPRYRSEQHDWEVISGTPVSVGTYITEDGGPRTKEIDFPLVQWETGHDGGKQAGELAAYEIVNSREAGPWRFTTGPKYFGIKTGDCITLNVPDEGIAAQPVIVRSVIRDPAAMKFIFTVETETEAKHDFALGKTSLPPPTWTPTAPDLTPPEPNADLWDLTAAFTGERSPSIIVTGVCEFPGADIVAVEYRKVGDAEWLAAGQHSASAPVNLVIASLEPLTEYEARVSYRSDDRVGPWLTLAAVETPNPIPEVPGVGAFGFSATSSASGLPLLVIAGAADDPSADTILVEYRATGDADWISGGAHNAREALRLKIGAGIAGLEEYEARVALKAEMYAGNWRHLGTATTPADTVKTTIDNFNNRNDRNDDTIPNVAFTTNGTAVDHRKNDNGTVDVNIEFSWTGDSETIDGFVMQMHGGTGTGSYTWGSDRAAETTRILRPDQISETFYGLNPVLRYRWRVRAYRDVDDDIVADGVIYSGWISPSLTSENPYRPETEIALTGVLIDGQPAADIVDAMTNFNAGNDRDTASVLAPTGLVVFHTLNKDGSANVTLNWDAAADVSSIDGIDVFHYERTSGTGYTIGADADNEDVFSIPPFKTSTKFSGIAADLNHSFAIRAYRIIAPDLEADRRKESSWVQPIGAWPYKPITVPVWEGQISTLPRMVRPGDMDVYASYTGALFSGQGPYTMQFSRLLGETDVSSSATWSIDEAWPGTSGLTLSIDATGKVTFTPVPFFSAWFRIKSVYEGVSEYHLVKLNTAFAPPPQGIADYTVVPDPEGATITNSTAPGDLLFVGQCKAGSGGNIGCRLFFWLHALDGVNTPAGQGTLRVRYRTAGVGSYSDGPTASSSAYHSATYPKRVILGSSGNITGLTPNANYDIQVYVARNSNPSFDATTIQVAPIRCVLLGT